MKNNKILVLKRDKTKEPFSPTKILRVTQAAGLTEDEAHMVAKNVTAVIQHSKKKLVRATYIQKLVRSELAKKNMYAANLFDWYSKIKKRDEGLQLKRS